MPPEFPSRGTPSGAPPDMVNHPPHYNNHPSGIECVDVAEHMSFNIGNAMKYLWRAGEKGEMLKDLNKAIWYIHREQQRLGLVPKAPDPN